jgi:L-ascorbate metabolism protein UlaG (beta-lactamase superfamily)
MIQDIQWLGHGSFLIHSDLMIFINPWRIVRTPFRADIILIGHDHYDHCSPVDVDKLRSETTTILGNERVAQHIPQTHVLRAWQSVAFGRVSIKTVPAYSTQAGQHAPSQGGLGFILSLNYFDIYYAGDTQLIPEMEQFRPDIAILPIDNDSTLSVESAVEAVKVLRPRWVIPSNWGATGEGVTELEAKRFKHLIGQQAEVILPTLRLSEF